MDHSLRPTPPPTLPRPATLALGVPESFDSPGVAVAPRPRETLSLAATRRLGDHFSLSLELGVPPRIEVTGAGVAAPPGIAGPAARVDLGDPALHPLASARQWSPVLAVHYHWREPAAALQPFAALGVTYTWFSGERIHPAFAAALDERFGQPMTTGALKPGPTTSWLKTEPLWAPAVALGFVQRGASRWSWGGALAWAALDTRSTLTIRAADGTELSRSGVDVRIDGLIGGIFLGYRLGA